jgi:hypothetical protein
MGQREGSSIWEVPDDVWTIIEPILNERYPARAKGHRRSNARSERPEDLSGRRWAVERTLASSPGAGAGSSGMSKKLSIS